MEAKEWGLKITQEIHKKWESVKESSPFFDSGYRVFYSPVKMSPQLMVIGFNPGGGIESFDPDDAQSIPTQHDYFNIESYHLARKMRGLFQKINKEDLLRDSVKLNLIFFRSNSMKKWGQLDASKKKQIESFCIDKNVEIILKLKPKCILAEGITTYRQLKKSLKVDGEEKVVKSKGRSRNIYLQSNFGDTKLIGITHPSGTRVSNEDWDLIATKLSEDLR